MRFNDITGKTFGRLTARWPAGISDGSAYWLCSCTCGGLAVTKGTFLSRGHTQSCGCLRVDANTTHGHALTRKRGGKTPEYRAFCAAKRRCDNPMATYYSHYGGRGIKFLFSSFEQFIAELGPRPVGKSLDRINNDGHYEPGNVRWATWSEQMKNRRRARPL